MKYKRVVKKGPSKSTIVFFSLSVLLMFNNELPRGEDRNCYVHKMSIRNILNILQKVPISFGQCLLIQSVRFLVNFQLQMILYERN